MKRGLHLIVFLTFFFLQGCGLDLPSCANKKIISLLDYKLFADENVGDDLSIKGITELNSDIRNRRRECVITYGASDRLQKSYYEMRQKLTSTGNGVTARILGDIVGAVLPTHLDEAGMSYVISYDQNSSSYYPDYDEYQATEVTDLYFKLKATDDILRSMR